MKLRRTQWTACGGLALALAAPLAVAQHDRGGYNHDNGNGNRGNSNYYNGMRGSERGGNYDQRYRDDDRDHHHNDSGGIGPGYGALIGGGGGAALGAVFGGGMKGTLIGGAAGAGLGALGGKLAQGSGDHHDHDYHH